MTFPFPRLYAIIDPAQTGGLAPVQVTEILLQAGVMLIQYRDKRGSSRRLFEASVQIADRVRGAGGIFLVNDRADVASLAGADGVHVGQDDLPVELARRAWGIGRPQGEPAPASRHSGLVGCSTHTLAQVRDADNDELLDRCDKVEIVRAHDKADRITMRAAAKAMKKGLVLDDIK